MNKTPLQVVTSDHGGKEKLVDALTGMVEPGEEESKEAFRARLLSMANSKLLRLHRAHSEVKERFGDKEKLVDAMLNLINRTKDNDYRESLLQWTATRLLDAHRDWEKTAKKKARKKAN